MSFNKQVLRHISAAAIALKERADEVNALNVYPVPDSDTGTNMSMTMSRVVKELEALPRSASREEVYQTVVRGAMMGGKGNSGVILSNLIQGICQASEKCTRRDSETLAIILAAAAQKAWKQCLKPMEGTILTTIRDMAEVASQAAGENLSYRDTLRRVADEAFVSAKRTPELMELHKECGVIDAGAFGLAILTEGYVGSVTGKNAIIPKVSTFIEPIVAGDAPDYNDFDEPYRYEIVFEFENVKNIDMSRFMKYLGERGGSIQINENRPLYKIHIHTDCPQHILTYAMKKGEVDWVTMNDLDKQLAELRAKLMSGEPKPVGVVTVANGSGIVDLLKSLGSDYVVQGGQTMNPSVEDLVDAISLVNAEHIILLPNNKNIMMAARQAADLADKPVALVPTTSVQQAIAALVAMQGDDLVTDKVKAMTEAIKHVSSGEITTAVKNVTALNGTPIRAHDLIGLAENKIVIVAEPGQSLAGVTINLIDEIIVKRQEVGRDSGVITVLAGQDLSANDFVEIADRLKSQYEDKGLEVECQRGEQPLYPVILSVE